MLAAQFEPHPPNGPNPFIHNPFNSNLKLRAFDRSSSYKPQTFGRVVPSALLLDCGPFCSSNIGSPFFYVNWTRGLVWPGAARDYGWVLWPSSKFGEPEVYDIHNCSMETVTRPSSVADLISHLSTFISVLWQTKYIPCILWKGTRTKNTSAAAGK